MAETPERLPDEYGRDYFESLDTAMRRADALQLKRTLSGLRGAGLGRGGEAEFTDAANYELGTPEEGRRRVGLEALGSAAGMGTEERLGSVAFERKRQFAEEEQARALQRIERQAAISQELMRLQEDLNRVDQGWGQTAGEIGGAVVGGFFGGMFGGSMGGATGAKAGYKTGGYATTIGKKRRGGSSGGGGGY